MYSKHKASKRRLGLESLENRRVMAASLGWDGPGQGSAELTYHIANSASSLTQTETDAVVAKAFKVWSDVVDVKFSPTSTPGLARSIDISFDNLDGPGGTLAQAYFPDDVNPSRIAGDIQFDAAETWEVGNDLGSRAFDLLWVAVHEIGHSLGLDHSDDPDSVLAHSVSPDQSFTSLSPSDIVEAQSFYAAAPSYGQPTPPAPPQPDLPLDPTPNPPTNPSPETPPSNDPTLDLPGNNEPFIEDFDGHGFWTEYPLGDSDGDHWSGEENFWFFEWQSHDAPTSDLIPENTEYIDIESADFWWESHIGGFSHSLDADVPADHNLYDATDTNDDGATTALDALLIINHISSPQQNANAFTDVNGDGRTTALDALRVINELSQRGASSPINSSPPIVSQANAAASDQAYGEATEISAENFAILLETGDIEIYDDFESNEVNLVGDFDVPDDAESGVAEKMATDSSIDSLFTEIGASATNETWDFA